MKKISKLFFVLLVSLLLVTGCMNKKEEVKVDDKKETVASKLVLEFEKQIKNEKDIEKIANTISKNETIKISVGVLEAFEGYLDGFDDEVKGFTKAYAIKPMISTQPFVAYVFETKDANKLKKTLEEKANKRWNVCTEADDLEIIVVDNYVFLVMSPSSFEE